MLYHGTAPNNWPQTAPARTSLAIAHGVCMVSTLCGVLDGSSPSFPMVRIISPWLVILCTSYPPKVPWQAWAPESLDPNLLTTAPSISKSCIFAHGHQFQSFRIRQLPSHTRGPAYASKGYTCGEEDPVLPSPDRLSLSPTADLVGWERRHASRI